MPGPTDFLRVNHAGECGAYQIYRAQVSLGRWVASDLRPLLAEFAQHERHHRQIFAAELARRGAPRCATRQLCEVGGWALGTLSALAGRSGIAACTEAVETVVLAHLRDQIEVFVHEGDLAGLACVAAILEEEEAHQQAARDQFQADPESWRYRAIHALARVATEHVIALGLRQRR